TLAPYQGKAIGPHLTPETRKPHAGDESRDGAVQLLPQLVGHAALVVVAVLAPTALRRVDRLVHGANDVGHRDLGGVAGEMIPAARAAHALHELAAAQLAEELLEIRERDPLPLADAGERHRTGGAMQGQVQHRGD